MINPQPPTPNPQFLPLVLASASPRRAALLAQIDLPFRVQPSASGENDAGEQAAGETAEAFATRLAVAKAAEVARIVPAGLVIGADTVVVAETLLGKPRDEAEALVFLLALSGRVHRVVTGVAVVEAGGTRSEAGCTVTRVRMRAFGPDEARRYIATGEPFDKAGGYGIQGRGALLVEEIRGDYFNVVGLPLVLLADLLGRFGLDVWQGSGASPGRSNDAKTGLFP